MKIIMGKRKGLLGVREGLFLLIFLRKFWVVLVSICVNNILIVGLVVGWEIFRRQFQLIIFFLLIKCWVVGECVDLKNGGWFNQVEFLGSLVINDNLIKYN